MAKMRADVTFAAKQPFVLSTIANGVATLTLNRPERFNPLSYQMISGIQAELDAIASDPAVLQPPDLLGLATAFAVTAYWHAARRAARSTLAG